MEKMILYKHEEWQKGEGYLFSFYKMPCKLHFSNLNNTTISRKCNSQTNS